MVVDKDGFRLHFDNLVANYFGNAMSSKFDLVFEHVDGKTIALIHVRDRSNKEVFITNTKGVEEFYIRRQASAESLTPREMIQYIKENWG